MSVNEGLVAVPVLVLARLAAAHVDELWDEWRTDPLKQGCCTRHCASCAALEDLLTRGLLDDLYRVYLHSVGSDGRGVGVWDVEKGQICREWLLAAWSKGRAFCGCERPIG